MLSLYNSIHDFIRILAYRVFTEFYKLAFNIPAASRDQRQIISRL